MHRSTAFLALAFLMIVVYLASYLSIRADHSYAPGINVIELQYYRLSSCEEVRLAAFWLHKPLTLIDASLTGCEVDQALEPMLCIVD